MLKEKKSASSYRLSRVLGASPASRFCVHPALRLFEDSLGESALSHTEDQTTGGFQSLALFRLTAGVIRLLTLWVAAPCLRREIQDSTLSEIVPGQ